MDWVQWPAMALSIVAAWLVASPGKPRRSVGFWIFLASNAAWIAWGLQVSAWALIALQIGLVAMNIRGVRTNEDPPKK